MKYVKENSKVYKKQYVDVFVRYGADGRIIPLSIEWVDGSRYMIDSVMDVRRAASLKCGGTGIRYIIKIQGRQKMLFFEDNPDKQRWFLEAEAESNKKSYVI